ncbi:hypothetical protein DFJ73DRAFT_805988 [Zopfochytrium polystomum]|nr:hypothetical protein DFJ73DRAFT_805988 [Zopfochytrium polystomum]
MEVDKAKLQLQTPADYDKLKSHLDAGFQLVRAFSQRDFVLDCPNHSLFAAGFSLTVRKASEILPVPESDVPRISIIWKESRLDDSHPFLRLHEREEICRPEDVHDVLNGRELTLDRCRSEIFREVLRRFPKVSIRSIGSFSNTRHCYRFGEAGQVLEVDRCTFYPMGSQAFFCLFDASEQSVDKSLNFLRDIQVNYCVHMLPKTSLFFFAVEKARSISPSQSDVRRSDDAEMRPPLGIGLPVNQSHWNPSTGSNVNMTMSDSALTPGDYMSGLDGRMTMPPLEWPSGGFNFRHLPEPHDRFSRSNFSAAEQQVTLPPISTDHGREFVPRRNPDHRYSPYPSSNHPRYDHQQDHHYLSPSSHHSSRDGSSKTRSSSNQSNSQTESPAPAPLPIHQSEASSQRDQSHSPKPANSSERDSPKATPGPTPAAAQPPTKSEHPVGSTSSPGPSLPPPLPPIPQGSYYRRPRGARESSASSVAPAGSDGSSSTDPLAPVPGAILIDAAQRQKNKEAAARYRRKKNEEIQEQLETIARLNAKVQELETDNQVLQTQVRMLKEQVAMAHRNGR